MQARVCTVTLNPTLDITYVVDRVVNSGALRALSVEETPGGKGINVSRALKAMGMDSIVMSVIGGFTGDEVLHRLRLEGLVPQIVRIKNETRTNVVIFGEEDGQELTIRSAGPPVEETETEQICPLIARAAEDTEIFVLSGSVPPGVNVDVYRELVGEGKARGAKVILDSSGEPFRLGVEAAPFMIKPNIHELEELAGEELKEEERLVGYCRELVGGGVQNVVVSMGRNGGLMVRGEGAWRGTVPDIDEDTVGAGDSLVAGLVKGLVEYRSVEEMFHMGLACGVSAVMNVGPGLCIPELYRKAFGMVEVERID